MNYPESILYEPTAKNICETRQSVRMNWPLKDTTSKRSGFMGMSFTFLFFIISTAVGIAVYPFANYFLFNGDLPTSSEATEILNGLRDNVPSILLSCIVGGVYALILIFAMRFGRFIGTFITLLEQLVIYNALIYFASWIMWKVQHYPGDTVFTMLPYTIYMQAAVITLEIAAIFGQSGRVAYNMVCLGSILGAFIGILRSVDLTYFSNASSGITYNADLGIAFARSLVDTTFFLGACALASACITRSKIGGSFLWHIAALVLPIGLACAFATTSIFVADIAPIIDSSTARWIVASLIALITVILALAVFAPIRKQAMARQPNVVSYMGRGVQQPVSVQGRPVATGPIAANAVILV